MSCEALEVPYSWVATLDQTAQETQLSLARTQLMEFDQLQTYIPTHGHSLFALQAAKLLKKCKDVSLSSEPKVDSKKVNFWETYSQS